MTQITNVSKASQFPNIVLSFTTENFTDVDIHGEWAVSSQNIWINESPTVCVEPKGEMKCWSVALLLFF